MRAPKDAPASVKPVNAKAKAVNKKPAGVNKKRAKAPKPVPSVNADIPVLPVRREEITAIGDDEPKWVERPWHELTISWWGDVWRSPMAAEFVKVDVHRLWILADLVDRYWWSGGRDLAAATEIRLQERAFGLDPMSRRSLQWEVPRKSEVGSEKDDLPAATRPRGKKVDPRKLFLKVVGG